MTRFGKKLTMVGIWAGIGLLIGMQFGGSSGMKMSQVLPGWNTLPDTAAQSSQVTGIKSQPVASTVTQGGKTYVYVPVTIDPATGAYTALPVQTQNDGTTPASSELPQQETNDYSTQSPEQILIPVEQKPAVDVLADKTAGLLQRASQKSIRWIVSLFASTDE
ncbi:hypothetical protein H1230_08400 [Paenibacillus sp. 19GGS1-52]|uniref:hypothetical protein n=1 Tax=Paenibacillus sp. 19GGS1-52 TaxID=2758563 RepID=UPI001EFB52EE|nr:hypothetical protein [Paenibacillus sp. 19GGS1-52]ULO08786.1 hypothetical protein H1230_08400 [Paenibacillus sp. 19GGS1-52]